MNQMLILYIVGGIFVTFFLFNMFWSFTKTKRKSILESYLDGEMSTQNVFQQHYDISSFFIKNLEAESLQLKFCPEIEKEDSYLILHQWLSIRDLILIDNMLLYPVSEEWDDKIVVFKFKKVEGIEIEKNNKPCEKFKIQTMDADLVSSTSEEEEV